MFPNHNDTGKPLMGMMAKNTVPLAQCKKEKNRYFMQNAINQRNLMTFCQID
jgi:hypothetical protein